jgi:hypothetical protein
MDMPITYSFVHHAIWLKVRGDALPQEFSEAINQALADEEFRVARPLVFDLQYYTRSPSTGDIRARVKFLEGLGEKISSTVVVIVSSTLHYGLSRMFKIIAEQNGVKVEIFKEEDKAIEWLMAAAQRTRSQPESASDVL